MVNRIATLLKGAGAVRRGDFVLSSGQRSSYYIDAKTALTSPEVLEGIGSTIAGSMEEEMVAGVAVGGIPIAVATALASRKPYAIVRREEKPHGIAGSVIGHVEGRRVLLVEDVTTTGASALLGCRVLREAGAIVERVMTVVDREEGAGELLKREGITLIALARVSDLLG